MGAMNAQTAYRSGRRRGYSIFGLLGCAAAASLLVLVLLPVYDNAKNKATLRATLADMEMWRAAIDRYISDNGVAPTNPNGRLRYKKEILRDMLPYLDHIRSTDWWGSSYWIWTGAGASAYGIQTTDPTDYILVSAGRGGLRETWRFDSRRPDAGIYRIEEPADFEKDIVLWNGRFVRGPVHP
jgi:type II secretory pathway pseudopilin PulG